MYTINQAPYTLCSIPRALPTPYILCSTPYTSYHILHPIPYTLHPTPYTLHPTPYTLHPTPYTLHPTPFTHTTHHTPCTRHRVLSYLAFHTLHSTPNDLPQTPYFLNFIYISRKLEMCNVQTLSVGGPTVLRPGVTVHHREIRVRADTTSA